MDESPVFASIACQRTPRGVKGGDYSMTGWLVVVRVWNMPDDHFYVEAADKTQAEDLVSSLIGTSNQVSVQAVRELTADEAKYFTPGNVVVKASIDGTRT